MSPPELWRLFVAVKIPQQVKDRLAAAQSELQRSVSESSVTWTKPEQFHVTLKFLGNVEAGQIGGLSARLRAACLGFSALHLQAEALGAFPQITFPRVIWAALHDTHRKLAQVYSAVAAAAQDFSQEPTESSFKAHVTLGRAKKMNRKDMRLLSELLSKRSTKLFGEWTANELDLMRSELSSTGARHTSIATFQFKA